MSISLCWNDQLSPLAGSLDTSIFLDKLEDEYSQVGQRALLVLGNCKSDFCYQPRETIPSQLQAKADTKTISKDPEITLATQLGVEPDYGLRQPNILLL